MLCEMCSSSTIVDLHEPCSVTVLNEFAADKSIKQHWVQLGHGGYCYTPLPSSGFMPVLFLLPNVNKYQKYNLSCMCRKQILIIFEILFKHNLTSIVNGRFHVSNASVKSLLGREVFYRVRQSGVSVNCLAGEWECTAGPEGGAATVQHWQQHRPAQRMEHHPVWGVCARACVQSCDYKFEAEITYIVVSVNIDFVPAWSFSL